MHEKKIENFMRQLETAQSESNSYREKISELAQQLGQARARVEHCHIEKNNEKRDIKDKDIIKIILYSELYEDDEIIKNINSKQKKMLKEMQKINEMKKKLNDKVFFAEKIIEQLKNEANKYKIEKQLSECYYVLCPRKRYENAKKIISEGKFYINGIGETKKIITDINKECFKCRFFDKKNSISAWITYDLKKLFCKFMHKRVLELKIMNKNGLSVSDIIAVGIISEDKIKLSNINEYKLIIPENEIWKPEYMVINNE